MKELKIESIHRIKITESCKIVSGKAKNEDKKSAGAIKIIGKKRRRISHKDVRPQWHNKIKLSL